MSGQTFFDTIKKSFTDVPIDAANGNAIPTTDFLEAVESVISLFDVLGATTFAMVKNDMANNVKKVRDRQTAAPAQSATVQELVKNEIASGSHTASEGLLWLTRGLEFTSTSLALNFSQPNIELNKNFQEGYKSTLKKHHGFVVATGVSTLLGAAPYRKDFYAKLGSPEEKVVTQLKEWVGAFEKVTGVLTGFMASPESKWKGRKD